MNKEQRQRHSRGYNARLRYTTLVAYGGESPKCSCCGESCYAFLCVDHIDGNGSGDHKGLYLRLKSEGFPSGFQVLCHNCNWGKFRYGKCPHKMAEGELEMLLLQERQSNIGERGKAGMSAGVLNRAKDCCPRGHLYDEENTYVSKAGRRSCRACRRKAVTEAPDGS